MRHKDPATASKAKVLADQIESVKATGPNEVTIVLSAPNADLPVILGTFHFHIVKEGTTDFNAGIGTGPYKLKEFKPGVRSLVVRNDELLEARQALPRRDRVRRHRRRERARQRAAVGRHGPGRARSIRARSRASRARPAIAIFKTQSGQYSDLVMRKDTGPGANPDFVLAMKHLFDREQMKKTIALD